MKITEKNLLYFVLCCAFALIALGIAGSLGLRLSERNEHWISQALFLAAALGFLERFRLRRKREQEEAARKQQP